MGKTAFKLADLHFQSWCSTTELPPYDNASRVRIISICIFSPAGHSTILVNRIRMRFSGIIMYLCTDEQLPYLSAVNCELTI